jgi:hypothetical protein
MANQFFGALSLTGGADGALDTINGSGVNDGDKCFVSTSGKFLYVYNLDDDSAASEDSPLIISPDTNADDKRWILQSVIYPIEIFTLDNTGTPSVAEGDKFLTGGTTTITDFDDGFTGQIIRVIAAHSLDITDATNILLSTGGTWSMTATDTLTLICKADNKWYELSRGDNGA